MHETSEGEGRHLVKAPQDLAAGVFLIALALFALWLASSLNAGTMRAMGPGMLPRAVAVLVGLCGVVLAVGAFVWRGPAIGHIPWRGPVFIALGIGAFGLTIRGYRIPLPGGAGLQTPALGLVGAGPLAIMIAGLASSETRWFDLVIFTAVMTTFCFLLFKVALKLPIPLAPFLIGY
jgi:hypothetical protein